MEDLLTTKQLQDLLKVDRITIYRMLGDGRLTGFKVGGQWRFSRKQIESWLQGQQGGHPPVDEPQLPPAQPLPLPCVEAIQAVYAEALEVAAVTTDLDGLPLTQVSGCCTFCSLILSTDEGRRRCAASWRLENGTPAAAQSQPGGEPPALRRCHAGLLCATAPIHVGGQWLANVATCQFVAETQARAAGGWQAGLPRLAAGLGLAESTLRAAAGSVPVWRQERLPRIPYLLRRVAETLGEIGQERARMVDRLQRIAEMTNLQRDE